MMLKKLTFLAICFSGCLLFWHKNSARSDVANATAVTLTLDWKPEPEFGGFYAASQNGQFARHGLNVSIAPAGEVPTPGNSSPPANPNSPPPRPTRSSSPAARRQT